MDRKSKILFIVFFLLIIVAIGATYYRYIVLRDYIIQAETDCDPYTEKCFVYVCDPTAGEECTGNPAEDTSYYKLIKRNAKNMPVCDPAAEDCAALVCPPGEADCGMTTCDAAVEPEGTCSDPIVYTEENPIEEEAVDDSTTTEEEQTDSTTTDGTGEPVAPASDTQGSEGGI